MRQPMFKMRQPIRDGAGSAGATVSSEYLRMLALGAEGRGLNLAPILASSAIDVSVLSQRGARVSVRAVDRVWNQINARLRDPGFGLRLVEILPFGTADLMDYLVRSSANAGAALETVSRYAALMSDAERLAVVVSGDEASFRFHTPRRNPHAVELIMGLFAQRSRDDFGGSWSFKQVSFAHDALGPRAAYDSICQAPIRFGMPFTEAVFDRELLAMPMPAADARLHAILRAQADGLLAKIAPPVASLSFADTIAQALTNGVSVGNFTLAGLADHLGLGVRTLQRRLRAEGLTHRSLVRTLRQDLALRSLATSAPQNQIARSLGYSGTGAFQRAFKAWSGVPPAAVRKKASLPRRARQAPRRPDHP
jgi:AraC-like DNA-binding protein